MKTTATQAIFSDAILADDENWGSKASMMGQLVRQTGSLTPQERVEIYRGTGLSARISALKQIYPVCAKILGESAFEHVAKSYVKEYPSKHYDLNLYGDCFAEYINEVKQFKKVGDLEYLNDLCLLEYYWHTVYYQENDNPFDFKKFEKYCDNANDIVLELSHSLRLLSTEYPVEKIWLGHQRDKTLFSVEGLGQKEYLCIYRKGFKPTTEVISRPYFEFLQACERGVSLAEVADNQLLIDMLPDIPILIQKGWVTGFRVDGNER